MDETRQLAQHVAQVRYESLSKEAVEKAKQLILDQLGCEPRSVSKREGNFKIMHMIAP